MGLFREKQEHPTSSYPSTNGYGDDIPVTNGYNEDMPIRCPPHTTERKLLARIDMHVIPFLCIMYRTRHTIFAFVSPNLR